MGESNEQEQYYSYAFSTRAYIQCDGDLLHVRPCAAGLYWNQETKICDREEVSSMRSTEDQFQSYQINSKLPQSESTVDQAADMQQGQYYQYYNPHTRTFDQRVDDMYMLKETPTAYAYFSPSLKMKKNRRVKNQQEFIPTSKHASIHDQNSMLPDQQQNSYGQLTPQRSLLRLLQS
jgi:hypothetical protein